MPVSRQDSLLLYLRRRMGVRLLQDLAGNQSVSIADSSLCVSLPPYQARAEVSLPSGSLTCRKECLFRLGAQKD